MIYQQFISASRVIVIGCQRLSVVVRERLRSLEFRDRNLMGLVRRRGSPSVFLGGSSGLGHLAVAVKERLSSVALVGSQERDY